MLVLFLCAVILFNSGPSASDSGSQQADNCTSGFMSLDRMEALVQGSYLSQDHVLGDLRSFPNISKQAIIPNMNFTCDGSILSWTFGAQWDANSQAHTELQIWRSSGDGSYTKVGSTTIPFEEENSTRLYQYTLTSPLPFQTGDILGFFQHRTSAHLQFEDVGSGHSLYHVVQDSPSNQFNIGSTDLDNELHMLINMQTDPAGCDCGFMSVERMRIVLGLDTVGNRNLYPVRQQITPDIRFNCDGLITKWIFGADWWGGNTYSELQVWRDIGNDVYHKVNSTSINVAAQNPSHIYEYDTFSPIPVLAGDILGMFHSQLPYTQVAIYSEGESGPLTYNLAAYNTNVSTFDTIDLQNMPSLATERYHPLVTVEMIASSLSSSTSLLIMTSSLSPVSSSAKSEPVATPPVSATEFINALDASTTPLPHNTEASMNSLPLIVGVGVTGTLLLLIITVVIVITALVCLRKKTNKLNVTDNVAYQSSTSEVNTLLNAAYATIGDHSPTSCDQEHVTAAAKGVGIITSNTVARPPTAIYEVCNTPTSTNEITTSINEVYYIMSTTSDGVYDIPTFTDGAYKITMPTNPASNTTGAPACTNQA